MRYGLIGLLVLVAIIILSIHAIALGFRIFGDAFLIVLIVLVALFWDHGRL